MYLVCAQDHNCWRFLKLDSLAFGRASAVVSFMVAVFGNAAPHKIQSFVGAPLAPDQCIPPAASRTLFGASF